jgi:hypothetical protein
VGGGFRVCGRASGCQWRPIGPDIPEHAFPRGRSPHPSADRVRGDRRRSLHSGNSDRRSADSLRGLPAAIISSEGPYGRRFSSYPVPDSGPCSGAKLCDDHFRVERQSVFSAVVGRHTAGVALRNDGVQGSAVRARGKGGNKQTVVAKPLFTLCTRGPPGEGEILRGWCP